MLAPASNTLHGLRLLKGRVVMPEFTILAAGSVLI